MWRIGLINYNILDCTKLKELILKMMEVSEMRIFIFQRLENIVGKEECWLEREKCWLPAFSPLPTMISKGLFLRGNIGSHVGQ